MKKNFSLLSIALMLIMPLLGSYRVQAASLVDVTVTPDALTVSTLVDVTVTFTPATAITTGTILTFTYDAGTANFDGGASLANGDIAISGTGITGKNCTGFLAGFFRCTLTTSGSVTTTVTTVIGNTNQLTTPDAAGNYSWSVTADIGGAGTTFDGGAGLAYIADENDVEVEAYVPPVLALDLYQTNTTTLLTNPNTCNLGVLSFNSVNTCSYDIGVGTNNSAGATIRITSDGQFTNGSHSFTQANDSTIVAGTEEYGFRISDLGTVFTDSADFNSATDYESVPTSATSIATSAAISNKATAAQHVEITHAATMSTATPVGSYDHTVTYTAFTD